MALLESLLLIVVCVFLALFCYFIVYWYEQKPITYKEKKTSPSQVAETKLNENKKDKRFQIELLRLQLTIEILITSLIGILAIEYSLFTYYGSTKQFFLQNINVALIVGTLVVFFIRLRRYVNEGFKKLEEKYL